MGHQEATHLIKILEEVSFTTKLIPSEKGEFGGEEE
jgi:hypothetical protein